MARYVARVLALGNELSSIERPGHGSVLQGEDYVLWWRRLDASPAQVRASFEAACEQLWQRLHEGIPPRCPN